MFDIQIPSTLAGVDAALRIQAAKLKRAEATGCLCAVFEAEVAIDRLLARRSHLTRTT